MNGLKLKIWTSPKNGEIRVYVDTTYVRDRSARMAHGVWIGADENGKTHFHWNLLKGNDRFGAHFIAVFLSGDYSDPLMDRQPDDMFQMPFSEFIERLNSCRTPGGNFSPAKWEKQFCPT